MCSKPKTPKVEKVEMPSAPAAPPPPEPVAAAPESPEGKKRQAERKAQKRGTGALRIDLGTGGSGSLSAGGLSIPR